MSRLVSGLLLSPIDPSAPVARGSLSRAGQLFLLASMALLGLGLAILFSASLHETGNPFSFLTRQAVGAALGLIVLVVAAAVDPRRYLHWAPVFLAANAALLVAVLFLGPEINQARRWLSIAGTSFQPSELVKITLPLGVAWLHYRFVRNGTQVRNGTPGLWVWCGALLAIVGVGSLIALQPDYGSALFVMAVSGFLLLLAGIPFRYPAAGLVLFAPLAFAFWQKRGDFIARRFEGFLDPTSSYQLQHSLNAIGSGGVFGKGFGLGWEKLSYLPEHFNDFIFAVYAEETGIIGVSLLLALFSLFLWSGWAVVRRCGDPTLRILGFAIVLNVVLQACINIAVATAAAPTKGIPLPFISHGSSGLTVLLLEVGILLAISRVREPRGAKP